MHLEDNVYPNEATFKKLISCCPVLEDLTVNICGKDKTVFQVHSLSLKTLTSSRFSLLRYSASSGVEINAPLLCSLSIKDNISKSFIVKNLGSSAKLDISILFGLWDFDKASLSSKSSNRRYLPGISKVREMIICPRTFKLLCQYAKLGPMPQFHNMSRLCVTLCVYDLKLLPTFLESFPNLKSIILDSNQNTKKLTICLLENSTILKKLTICLNYCSPNDFILKKLREIPRRSITCQVSIVYD